MLANTIFYVALALYVVSPFLFIEAARGRPWFRNWNGRTLGFTFFLLSVEGYSLFLMHLALGAGALPR
jgi:hypothetical protein